MTRTIATVAVCTFLVAWLFLASQLRAGHDPALGPASPPAKHAAAATHNSAPVLVTRTSGGG